MIGQKKLVFRQGSFLSQSQLTIIKQDKTTDGFVLLSDNIFLCLIRKIYVKKKIKLSFVLELVLYLYLVIY